MRFFDELRSCEATTMKARCGIPVLAGNWQERSAEQRRGPLQATGRVFTFAPEYVDSYPFVPCLNGWWTPQNPVHLTVSVGSIPTSGTKIPRQLANQALFVAPVFGTSATPVPAIVPVAAWSIFSPPPGASRHRQSRAAGRSTPSCDRPSPSPLTVAPRTFQIPDDCPSAVVAQTTGKAAVRATDHALVKFLIRLPLR